MRNGNIDIATKISEINSKQSQYNKISDKSSNSNKTIIKNIQNSSKNNNTKASE